MALLLHSFAFVSQSDPLHVGSLAEQAVQGFATHEDLEAQHMPIDELRTCTSYLTCQEQVHQHQQQH